MDRPLVSIITPTFNSANRLEGTILSIKAQTYQNIEHLIIDGGSTDGTLDLIRRHAGSYNLRWVSEPDRGMYDAQNKGLAMARGGIFGGLDSDDLYPPWAVEVAVQHLQRHRVVFGDLVNVNTVEGYTNLNVRYPYWAPYYRAFSLLDQPTVFWHREITDRIGGFDLSYKVLADVEYWFRMDHAGYRPHKINEILAVTRHHPANFRSQWNESLNRDLERIRATYSTPRNRLTLPLFYAAQFYLRLRLLLFASGARWVYPRFRESGALVLGLRELARIVFQRPGCAQNLSVAFDRFLPVDIRV